MTEKLSDDFLLHYRTVSEKIRQAAESVGRSAEEITLLAATKTVDAERINHAISCGLRVIAENRVQEFLQKKDLLLPVEQHFIGHLQTNKVRDIVGQVALIHSVDSLHLAQAIEREAEKKNCVQDILLEVNIGDEPQKSGFAKQEVLAVVTRLENFPHLRVRGLMAVPPVCSAPEENRKYFRAMRNLFLDIGTKKMDNGSMEILSMGMSDDYEVAITEGATVVRIGSALFGKRNYQLL